MNRIVAALGLLACAAGWHAAPARAQDDPCGILGCWNAKAVVDSNTVLVNARSAAQQDAEDFGLARFISTPEGGFTLQLMAGANVRSIVFVREQGGAPEEGRSYSLKDLCSRDRGSPAPEHFEAALGGDAGADAIDWNGLSRSGVLTITERTKNRIRGTFRFTACNLSRMGVTGRSVEVEGSFDARIPVAGG